MTVRILVADDSRASQPSIITQLPRSLHFDVTEAFSSQEIITLLNTAEFELLLLNLSRSPADNFRVVEAMTHALCKPPDCYVLYRRLSLTASPFEYRNNHLYPYPARQAQHCSNIVRAGVFVSATFDAASVTCIV